MDPYRRYKRNVRTLGNEVTHPVYVKKGRMVDEDGFDYDPRDGEENW